LNTAVAVDSNGLVQPSASFLQPSSTVLEKRIVQFGMALTGTGLPFRQTAGWRARFGNRFRDRRKP
jgi:hypothetical protein